MFQPGDLFALVRRRGNDGWQIEVTRAGKLVETIQCESASDKRLGLGHAHKETPFDAAAHHLIRATEKECLAPVFIRLTWSPRDARVGLGVITREAWREYIVKALNDAASESTRIDNPRTRDEAYMRELYESVGSVRGVIIWRADVKSL